MLAMDRAGLRVIWKCFLREFVLHVFNLHCHPQNVRRRPVCLGIGVWMSTTSVASKSFDFEDRQPQACAGHFSDDAQ